MLIFILEIFYDFACEEGQDLSPYLFDINDSGDLSTFLQVTLFIGT